VWLIVVILIATYAIAARRELKAEAQKKAAAQKRNDASVQSALLTYSRDLKPGVTRKRVEDYLRSRHTGFTQSSCYEEPITLAILAKVGEGEKPWYCSEWPVYVVFEFSVSESHDSLRLPDSDALKKVHLMSRGEGCL
jgi:hypothetical protein